MPEIKEYNRERAVAYARRWALDRNPLFFDFTGGGGNCTNFVSQCILAGCCQMNFTPDIGWYYLSPDDRAAAWTGVEFFYNFIIGNAEGIGDGLGPFGREVRMRQVQVGDVIQLARAGDFYHTLLVCGIDSGDIFVCAHADDALDRRLSTYNFDTLRFIHIDGVRMAIREDDCFRALNEGIALP